MRWTLLSVGTAIRKSDLQSVHKGGAIKRSMIHIAPTDVPPNECEGGDTSRKR